MLHSFVNQQPKYLRMVAYDLLLHKQELSIFPPCAFASTSSHLVEDAGGVRPAEQILNHSHRRQHRRTQWREICRARVFSLVDQLLRRQVLPAHLANLAATRGRLSISNLAPNEWFSLTWACFGTSPVFWDSPRVWTRDHAAGASRTSSAASQDSAPWISTTKIIIRRE